MRVQGSGVGECSVGTVAMRIVDVPVCRNDGRGGGEERIVLMQVKGKVPEGWERGGTATVHLSVTEREKGEGEAGNHLGKFLNRGK